jgi:nucleoside-diphosphate-sugar epimerase
MKIGVTGATGFIGQNLIPVLLTRGHQIVALSRDRSKAEVFQWFVHVNYISGDINEPDAEMIAELAECDAVIHLAWPGLPSYSELFHIEVNYPAAYRFLKSLVEAGLKRLLVTGTCFEYGMQNGCLSEDTPAKPVNAYGVAKDFLYRSLQQLQTKHSFDMQWLRLFYQFGPGQSENSLTGQLDRAIAENMPVFRMSRGEQLRDYLHISETSELLASIIEKSHLSEVINVCCGQPISIRCFVEARLKERDANIALELGYYKYSPYEPLAFWGDRGRLEKVIGSI